jgi:hypothetical protein
VDTNDLERQTATVFRVEMNSVRMWPGYIGMVTRNMVTQNQGRGEEEEVKAVCPY